MPFPPLSSSSRDYYSNVVTPTPPVSNRRSKGALLGMGGSSKNQPGECSASLPPRALPVKKDPCCCTCAPVTCIPRDCAFHFWVGHCQNPPAHHGICRLPSFLPHPAFHSTPQPPSTCPRVSRGLTDDEKTAFLFRMGPISSNPFALPGTQVGGWTPY